MLLRAKWEWNFFREFTSGFSWVKISFLERAIQSSPLSELGGLGGRPGGVGMMTIRSRTAIGTRRAAERKPVRGRNKQTGRKGIDGRSDLNWFGEKRNKLISMGKISRLTLVGDGNTNTLSEHDMGNDPVYPRYGPLSAWIHTQEDNDILLLPIEAKMKFHRFVGG
jgi:hypothetical protein